MSEAASSQAASFISTCCCDKQPTHARQRPTRSEGKGQRQSLISPLSAFPPLVVAVFFFSSLISGEEGSKRPALVYFSFSLSPVAVKYSLDTERLFSSRSTKMQTRRSSAVFLSCSQRTGVASVCVRVGVEVVGVS